jgi:sugar/nucleoside kinase (ribokinase family)
MIPSAAFLGLTTLDIVNFVDAYPAENQKIRSRRQGIFAGGPATNAAVTFARLGGKARLISARGSHPAAGLIAADLGRFPIELIDMAGDDFIPSISSIVVSAHSGSRTVVSTNATAGRCGQVQFSPAMLEGVSLLLVDGHDIDFAIEAARQAKVAGLHVVFDGGSWKPGTEGLLKHVDTVICSADFRPPDLAQAPAENVLDYLSQAAGRCALTRGAQPILFGEGDSRGEVAVPRIEAADTLAAGDIFHGAYCYFSLAFPGKPFKDLLADAAAVASLSCRYFGPREWMEHYDFWSGPV